MTNEQQQRLALIAEQVNEAYRLTHVAMLGVYDSGMLGVTDMDTRVWISEAEMRLGDAAEELAKLHAVMGATNG